MIKMVVCNEGVTGVKTVVCNVCNWTSFAVSKAHAAAEVKSFNAYFATLTQATQDEYYGGKNSSLARYSCQRCGSESFQPGNTAPEGSTLSPVIYEEIPTTPRPALCSEHATLIPITGSALLDSDACEVCAVIERCKT